MSKIIGQKAPLSILAGVYKTNRMHHAYFFHGEEGVGKFESAMNFAKALYCVRQNGTYCDECVECAKVNEYRHPDVIVLSTDPRHIVAKFFYDLAKKHTDVKYFRAFKSHARNILSRLEGGFLPAYETYPSTSPEAFMVGSKSDRARGTALEVPYAAMNATLARLTPTNLSRIDDVYSEERTRAIDVAKSRGGYRGGKKTEGKSDTFFGALETLYHNIMHTTLPIDSVREVIRRLDRKPSSPHGRTVIIEGVDLMESSCANIFLRTLEEPPEGNRFVLITSALDTMRDDVLGPLGSRTMQIGFNALSAKSITRIVTDVFGLAETDAASFVALGRGSVGRAIRLSQSDGGTARDTLVDFFRAALNNDAAAKVSLIKAMSENEEEAIPILIFLREFVYRVVKKRAGDADTVVDKEIEALFLDNSAETLIVFAEALDELIRQSHGRKTKKKLLVLRVFASLGLLVGK